MCLFTKLIRPILFRCDAEWVHDRTIDLGERVGRYDAVRKLLSRAFAYRDLRLVTTVAGIQFENPIGLAAGFDKNGRAVNALSALGFGFIEIGSISAQRSDGNPRPRLFRPP